MNERAPPKTDTLGGTIVLLVLGLLVLLPSGLCTGYFGILGLWGLLGEQHDPYVPIVLGGALLFGGPFVIAGAAMLWIGIRRWRKR